MSEAHALGGLALLFGVAVALVVVLHRLRLPPIAGFLVAGAVAGPQALGLIGERVEVEQLAELGVIALLFGIGLELPLSRVQRLWRPLLLGGGMQMALTMAATAAIARALGLEWSQAWLVGGMIAVSSTAIVLRSLQETGQVEAPHGRATLSILIFQDLSVVPLMMLVPFLAGRVEGASGLLASLGRVALVLAAALLLGRPLVRRLLRAVAKTRQQSLFVLTVLAICLGTAWLAGQAGVSLALGAFLAGMVVAESEYRHQALSDLIPFREAFTSLFFLSIGMLLDPRALAADWANTGALAAAIMAGKFALVLALGACIRLPFRVVLMTAFALAQAGEFSFLLLDEASGAGLLDPALTQRLLAASILTMLAAPFILRSSPRAVDAAERWRWLTRWFAQPEADDPDQAGGLRDHVIIGGYGLTGQELARMLQARGVPFVVADLNPDNVRRARAAGQRALFGDVASPTVLAQLAAEHAREIVLVVNDPNAAERAIRAVRAIAPRARLVVRTPLLADVAPMRMAGASEVVPMELETAAEVVARMMRHRGAPEAEVQEALGELHRRHGCPKLPA